MRRRLLRTFVSVALFAVVVLGIPLGLIGRMFVRQDASRRADREADTVGFAVQRYLDAGEQIPDSAVASFVGQGRYILVTDPRGETVTFGNRIDSDALQTSISLGDGSTVTLRVPDEDVDRRQMLVVIFVAGLSLASVALAAALGALLARRLSRPLDSLATVSHRLGDGDFTARADQTGLAEVDAVANALNSCAQRIGAMVMSEREFSANASHQLRTPLTALRLRLEEINEVGDEQVRVESSAAMKQADRLEATISDLLLLAREGTLRQVDPIDLVDVVRLHEADWRQVCAAAGRRLVISAPKHCHAAASAGGAVQVIQTLIENAVQHGRGTVRLAVIAGGGAAIVQVSDNGSGIAAGDESAIFDRHVSSNPGHGVGLALARTLAAADGGHLDLVRRSPPTFQLLYRASLPEVSAPWALHGAPG